MKANDLYLFNLKTLVNRHLYNYIYFDNLLKKYSYIENPITIYQYDTIDRFEKDYLIIEDTILNCPKQIDLNIFLYHIQDFIKEIEGDIKTYLFEFELLKNNYYSRKRDFLMWPYDKEIQNTDEFFLAGFYDYLSRELINYKDIVSKLISKYGIILARRVKDRIKTIKAIEKDDKIYIENFELFMAAVNVCFRKGGIRKNENHLIPSNKELFDYLEQHFTFKGRYKSIKILKRSSIETNYSRIASSEASFKLYQRYEEILLNVLKSIK